MFDNSNLPPGAEEELALMEYIEEQERIDNEYVDDYEDVYYEEKYGEL